MDLQQLNTFKTLHLLGVVALFSSLGSILLASARSKAASILHGVSLLLILLIGFAMLGKPPMEKYWWMLKLVLWLFIGGAPALAKRKIMAGPLVLALCIAAAGFAAWLGLAKPF